MIGDGATDMEACPPADVFIGFGGNVIRQQVKDNAKWYITDGNFWENWKNNPFLYSSQQLQIFKSYTF